MWPAPTKPSISPSTNGCSPSEPRMDDFNSDNQKLDQAVGEHTADTTLHITSSERSKWNGAPKLAVGTYVGNNALTRTISVGFTPKFCAVFAQDEMPVDPVNEDGCRRGLRRLCLHRHWLPGAQGGKRRLSRHPSPIHPVGQPLPPAQLLRQDLWICGHGLKISIKKDRPAKFLIKQKTRRKRKMVCGGFCGLDNLDFHGNGKINKYPPAKPGVFHRRAKPSITSGKTASRRVGTVCQPRRIVTCRP